MKMKMFRLIKYSSFDYYSFAKENILDCVYFFFYTLRYLFQRSPPNNHKFVFNYKAIVLSFHLYIREEMKTRGGEKTEKRKGKIE